MYKKIPQVMLLLCLSVVLIWLTFTYLLPISLPFLLGIFLALLAEPLVAPLSRRLPRTAASAIGVTLVFLLTAAILTFLFTFFLRQLTMLRDFWPQLEQAYTHAIQSLQQWILQLAPRMPDRIHGLLDRLAQDLLSDSSAFLSGFLSRLPQMATQLLGDLSQWLFGLVTGIISGYMLSIRLPGLRAWLGQKLPQRWQTEYLPAVKTMKKALGGWVMAEMKLALVAFVLLLAGFFLLRLEHSLMLASLITLVDAFPVLGVGTVLVPWSLLELIQGNRGMGLGLLGLYVLIWLIRSVLEPKLLGKELGLDPLVTLVCIYAGFRLWGLSGMLLSPIIAMAITQTLKRVRS